MGNTYVQVVSEPLEGVEVLDIGGAPDPSWMRRNHCRNAAPAFPRSNANPKEPDHD